MKRDTALEISGVSKHQYYYISKQGKRGRKSSLTTQTVKGLEISNAELVRDIKEIYQRPDSDYGYIKMSYALKSSGIIINKKRCIG